VPAKTAFDAPAGFSAPAGDQLDNIAGHKLIDRHRQAGTVASYRCLYRYRPAQRLNRILSADFLDEINRHADRDDDHHDQEACDVASRCGQSARHQQDDDQRIAEAGEKLEPERRFFDDGGVVGSEGFQPRLGFGGTKARPGRHESCEKPINRLLPDFFRAEFVNCGVHGESPQEFAGCRSKTAQTARPITSDALPAADGAQS